MPGWRAWADASFRRGSAGLAALLVTPDGGEERLWTTEETVSSVAAEVLAIEMAARALAQRDVPSAIIHSDCQSALRAAQVPVAYRLAYARDGRISQVDRMANRVRRGLAPIQGRRRPLPAGLRLLMADRRPRSLGALAAALPFRHRRPRERTRLALDLLMDNLDALAWQDGGILLLADAAPGALVGEALLAELLRAAGSVGALRSRRIGVSVAADVRPATAGAS